MSRHIGALMSRHSRAHTLWFLAKHFELSKCFFPEPSSGGVVTSPSYPSDYPADLDTVFPLQSHPGQRVNIFFVDFDLENVTDCTFDWLKVTALIRQKK